MDKRTQRKLERQMQDESRWLQKTLFALDKARVVRAKISETRGEDLNPLITLEDGTSITIDALDDVIRERVEFLRKELGQGVHGAGR
jgi:hypothetical protein